LGSVDEASPGTNPWRIQSGFGSGGGQRFGVAGITGVTDADGVTSVTVTGVTDADGVTGVTDVVGVTEDWAGSIDLS